MTAKRHLIVRLEAPLMSFGREAVDKFIPKTEFPVPSMLTGMLANALGWDRADGERTQRLQDRVRMAVRLDRASPLPPRTDFQTSQLGKSDRSWTTSGVPDGRGGMASNYGPPQLSYRDYIEDGAVTVAFRLYPELDSPDLREIALALEKPARPLFIGRKSCIPAAKIHAGEARALTALDALRIHPSDEPGKPLRAFWQDGEGLPGVEELKSRRVSGLRNWVSRMHAGEVVFHEGLLDGTE